MNEPKQRFYVCEVKEWNFRWIFGVFSSIDEVRKSLVDARLGHLCEGNGPYERLNITVWDLDQHKVEHPEGPVED